MTSPIPTPDGFITAAGFVPRALLDYTERVIGNALALWAAGDDDVDPPTEETT